MAKGRIAREAGFENVSVQPAAGDDGIAIGCAYYGHLAIQKQPRSFVMTHAYLGTAYSEGEVAAASDQPPVRLAETGIDYLVLHDTLIGKAALHRVLTPIIRVYADVGTLVRTAMRS